MAIRISNTRVTSREGINATQTFFEANECVFQEIGQQNDFGKDAYVDLVEGGTVSFLCAALQIKSGESYRAANGDYFVPVDSHADTWRRSTVPVFGVVYDPADRLLRWVDLTGYLRVHPHQEGGSVPVSRNSVLNELSLRGELTDALSRYAARGNGAVAWGLLSSGDLQSDAVFDAWALGRHDHRYLLLLRRLILDLKPSATRAAIFALGHLTPHPDIFWSKDNWIPQEIKNQVKPSFTWSPDEIAHMTTAIEPEEWGRGTLGQSFDMLMYEDPNNVAKLHQTVGLLLARSDIEAAVRIAALVLTHSRDQRRELSLLKEEHPTLMQSTLFREIVHSVQMFGTLSLY